MHFDNIIVCFIATLVRSVISQNLNWSINQLNKSWEENCIKIQKYNAFNLRAFVTVNIKKGHTSSLGSLTDRHHNGLLSKQQIHPCCLPALHLDAAHRLNATSFLLNKHITPQFVAITPINGVTGEIHFCTSSEAIKQRLRHRSQQL